MELRTKSVEQSIADTDEEGSRLRKDLSWWDLTVFGVSVVVGAGIFTVTASTAGNITGPAISISFLIAAVACGLAALCYAEFASTVPVAGSAYTFSYATFGEFIAWVIGWDLILEFAVGAAVVAKSWSSYLGSVFGFSGGTADLGALTLDWGALLIIGALTVLLAMGTKLSANVSTAITAIKVSVVLLVVVVGAFYIRAGDLGHRAVGVLAADGRRRQHLRVLRSAGRRVDRVLRVHRFRRRGHDRGGDQEPATRRAARHFGHARDRHRPVRRGGRRAVGHGALHPAEGRGRRARQPRHRVQGQRRGLGRRRSSRSGRCPG
jgi:hypothetical protein